LCYVSFFFFFSSRRRHTRFSRDWSSDVCSSDLDVAWYDPKNASYMNVVTASSHDSSTLRQWWHEDRELTEQYFRYQLGQAGTAQIGRASCRERVSSTVGADSREKKRGESAGEPE